MSANNGVLKHPSKAGHDESETRIPPHNRDAERSLLSSMLRDNNIINDIVHLVKADNFYVYGHQKIYEAITKLNDDDGKPADIVTVAEWLMQEKLLDDAGGSAYLAELWDAAPCAANYREYADIIRKSAARRQTIELADKLRERAFDLGESADDTLQDTELRIYEINETAGTAVYREQGINDIELPAPPAWPVLRREAMHGIAGEIVTAMEPETEADPVGLLLQLLAAAGNAIGRTAHARVEGDRHYCNLFVMNVGKSGHGRKGTSWGRVYEVMDIADQQWLKSCLASGMSSGEGLINRVRDSRVAENADGEPDIVDPGILDKRLFVIETEFGQVLRGLQRESNTLSAIIRNAWDRGNLGTLTKSPLSATNAHVTINGHITEPELHRYFEHADLFNGFANRFLWVLVKRSKLLPEGGLRMNPSLGNRLQDSLSLARRLGELDRADDTRELWTEIYPRLTEPRPGLWGTVTGRAESQVLRLAVLYAALRGNPVIMVDDLQAALAVWDYCEHSARLIFGAEEQLSKLATSIIKKLEMAGERGMTRTEIRNALGRNVFSEKIVAALAELANVKRARTESSQTGGRRPAERWFAVVTPIRL